ncbi:MAG: SSNA1 family protein [Methermicoccaceae archaeon]
MPSSRGEVREEATEQAPQVGDALAGPVVEAGMDEEVEKLRDKIRRQKNTIKALEERNKLLKRRIEELEDDIIILESKIRKYNRGEMRIIKKDHVIQEYETNMKILKNKLKKEEKRVRELEERVRELKIIRKRERDGSLIPLKVIECFSKEGIREAQERLGIKKGDVVYLRDASGGGVGTAELLCLASPRAVLYGGEMAHEAKEVFLKKEVPVIPEGEIPMELEGAFCAKPEALKVAVQQYTDERERWLIRRKGEMLTSILSEYRGERMKREKRG